MLTGEKEMKERQIAIWTKPNCLVVIAAIAVISAVPGWIFIQKAILSDGYKLPVSAYFLILPAEYFMSVFIHEMGHFLTFSRNGLKVRALFLSALMFIRENNTWKVKFCPNSITLLGGAVIPDVSVVKSQEEFDKIRMAYARAIAAGPDATVAFYVIAQLIAFPFILQQANEVLQLLFCFVSLFMALVTIFLLFISLFHTETVISDIHAAYLCQTNPSFVAMQIYQYSVFSSNSEVVRRESQFLRDIILDSIEKKLYSKDIGIIELSILNIFIMEYLTGDSDHLPKSVLDFITRLMYTPSIRKKIHHSEVGTYLWFHIVILLGLMDNTRDKALEEYDFLVNNINTKDMVNWYLMHQARHALGLADHSAFLSNRSNICASSLHGMWKYFDGYYTQEIKLNKFIISNISCRNSCLHTQPIFAPTEDETRYS